MKNVVEKFIKYRCRLGSTRSDPTRHNVSHVEGFDNKIPHAKPLRSTEKSLIWMAYLRLWCCVELRHQFVLRVFFLSLITWNFYSAVIFATCFFRLLLLRKKLRLNWKMLLEKFLSLLAVSASARSTARSALCCEM